jgi:SAM-dependent methyltransferase
MSGVEHADAAREQIEAWRAVASGWERRRALFWEATRPVSERMVELLAPAAGDTVLDLAAGPGDTGFLVVPRLGPSGRLISTDVAPEMVAAARRRAAELGLDGVDFRVADAAALDLDDACVDGILCRFGLMLVVDAAAAANEMRRVLRASGRAALGVWAPADENPWISGVGAAALELGLAERPSRDAPGPFRFADSARLVTLLESAGLRVLAVEDVPITWHAASADEWWDATRDTSRMLSALLERLDEEEADRLRRAAEARLTPYVVDGGAVVTPGLARVVLAEAAHTPGR